MGSDAPRAETQGRGSLFRLGTLHGESVSEYRYADTFQQERTRGPDRLRIGAKSPISLLWKLTASLPGPFFVLYLLHTTRCANALGRYQSPMIELAEADRFLAGFREFLSNDGRHDLWLHSVDPDATLVWDRHDLIFAYGALDRFRAVLEEQGFREGSVDGPPTPHVHQYHGQYDDSETKILRHFSWSRSPLLPGDEQ